jgi:hypothetical protein
MIDLEIHIILNGVPNLIEEVSEEYMAKYSL